MRCTNSRNWAASPASLGGSSRNGSPPTSKHPAPSTLRVRGVLVCAQPRTGESWDRGGYRWAAGCPRPAFTKQGRGPGPHTGRGWTGWSDIDRCHCNDIFLCYSYFRLRSSGMRSSGLSIWRILYPPRTGWGERGRGADRGKLASPSLLRGRSTPWTVFRGRVE